MADVAGPSTSTTVVLRKRRRSHSPLVLRISSSPTPSHAVVLSESESEQSPLSPVVSIALEPGPSTLPLRGKKKRYACDFDGCDKAYSKPSRLAEHQRSHTGDRPYICTTCRKSYLRESHLQAHSRSHLPESARPFVCEEAGCGKRFWTSQHLRVHENLHRGEKPIRCNEPSCEATFAKQYQLREHICSTHAPPGTKSYPCDHAGCTKSFATNQKLRAHTKTHDGRRYTCVHTPCLASPGNPPTYFANWTALQHHMRTAHPPTCPYPTCGGKTFTAQKGLRAHLKIHAERDLEAELEKDQAVRAAADPDDRPRKKRRGGEVGRDWICQEYGCGKDFKSKKALATHRNVTHLGRRDFACPTCERTFGYKHLLQRHTAKAHPTEPASSDSESDSNTEASSGEDTEDSEDEKDDEDQETAKPTVAFSIDFITGAAYEARSQVRLGTSPRSLKCPFPYLPSSFREDESADEDVAASKAIHDPQCQYVFSRAYDLRRHLLAEHEVELGKEVVDEWVKSAKATRAKGAS
ncbi:uncharacterized protein B0H18DRAFT_867289 [Fomitopsis serialis]|uniref:uncharacterized protein n=1 Tax=Fomitopsis serialis TaxID=139415 RepID=UPI002007F96C|nr:uncharacterized protein B0H18DRAFT_867289 [Neoantrodia serialis]KAH9937572.1 hypothetical protein B0H18DRAFT_867289 [Neoantrodia serialis]